MSRRAQQMIHTYIHTLDLHTYVYFLHIACPAQQQQQQQQHANVFKHAPTRPRTHVCHAMDLVRLEIRCCVLKDVIQISDLVSAQTQRLSGRISNQSVHISVREFNISTHNCEYYYTSFLYRHDLLRTHILLLM